MIFEKFATLTSRQNDNFIWNTLILVVEVLEVSFLVFLFQASEINFYLATEKKSGTRRNNEEIKITENRMSQENLGKEITIACLRSPAVGWNWQPPRNERKNTKNWKPVKILKLESWIRDLHHLFSLFLPLLPRAWSTCASTTRRFRSFRISNIKNDRPGDKCTLRSV